MRFATRTLAGSRWKFNMTIRSFDCGFKTIEKDSIKESLGGALALGTSACVA
jgi:hypothetical protein